MGHGLSAPIKSLFIEHKGGDEYKGFSFTFLLPLSLPACPFFVAREHIVYLLLSVGVSSMQGYRPEMEVGHTIETNTLTTTTKKERTQSADKSKTTTTEKERRQEQQKNNSCSPKSSKRY